MSQTSPDAPADDVPPRPDPASVPPPPPPGPADTAALPATGWPPGGTAAPDLVTRWLTAATRGISAATVVRAGVEALVVVGGTLVLLSILLVPVLAAIGSDAGSGDTQVDLGAGAAVRAAAVLLGLAAFGRLTLDLEAVTALFQGSGSASLAIAPLTITAALVVGFAVAARARPRAGLREHVQACVLAGVAAGALLAVISVAAATSTVPGIDTDVLGFRFHAGVGPWRVLLTGGLLAALAGFVPLALSHARAGWGGARALPWVAATSTAVRFVLLAGVLAVLVVLALVLFDGGSSPVPGADGSDDATGALAAWVLMVALLPNAAGVLVGLATGTSATASAAFTGQAAPLLAAEGFGPGGLQRSVGLWSQPGDGRLWLALLAALLVLAVVAVRGALLGDPRASTRGDWWRTGTVFAALAVVGVWITGASGAVTLGPAAAFGIDPGAAAGVGLSGASLGAAAGRAGLSLLGAVPLAFGLGALTAVVQRWVTRPAAGALPTVVASASRLPGGVHPLWSLLLVDACARLGRRTPARLVGAARSAEGEAEGLEPLTVDPARSRVALAVLTTTVALVVVVPVALVVLSTTVFGPGAAARGYADALRSGDAAALREAGGERSGPALTEAALETQRAAAPLTDVRATVDTSGGVPTATVAFRVGGSEHVQQVALERSADRVWGVVPRWRATASLPRVSVSAPAVSESVTVNGQEVSVRSLAEEEGSVAVFPGQVTIVPTVPAPLAVAAWKGVAADDSAAVEATFRVSMTPAARELADAAVATWLEGCAASTDLEAPGCPAQVPYPQGGSQSGVRWEYDEPTDVTVTPDADTGLVLMDGEVDARVTYSYSGYFSTGQTQTAQSERTTSFEGVVTYRDGSATFDPDGIDYD